MQSLIEAVLDLVGIVSPEKVRVVADELRAISNPMIPRPAMSALRTPTARAAFERLFDAWLSEDVNVSGEEVAGLLIGAAENRRSLERDLGVELVWTGPTTRFVPTRRTEQVLLDLIDSAESDLFLVSFVAYDVSSIVKAMNAAIDRGVALQVLLEASVEHGGTLQVDPSETMRKLVPGLELFTWRDKPEPFTGGKVHAKVVVVDGSRAFITSANLTGHALEKNMEAGVLLNGGHLPRKLLDHLAALIKVGIVAPV